VAEITETARNAEAQIAQLASHSTDDDAGRPSSPQPMNHDPRHRRDDGGDRNGGAALLTPDGNIRPVAAFITIPHGMSLSKQVQFCLFYSFVLVIANVDIIGALSFWLGGPQCILSANNRPVCSLILHCGQLTHTKISKNGATRCQILRQCRCLQLDRHNADRPQGR